MYLVTLHPVCVESLSSDAAHSQGRAARPAVGGAAAAGGGAAGAGLDHHHLLQGQPVLGTTENHPHGPGEGGAAAGGAVAGPVGSGAPAALVLQLVRQRGTVAALTPPRTLKYKLFSCGLSCYMSSDKSLIEG